MARSGIVRLSTYLPGDPVSVDAITNGTAPPMSRSPLLSPPPHRRHVGRELRAAEMIEAAARSIFDDLGREPAADVVLTNVLLPDTPITGAGAETAARLGLSPTTVLDVHNGGCGSFPFMLELTGRLLDGERSRTALIANVQNTAGKVFSQPQVRTRRHALAAGDGCGVALVEMDRGAPVLATVVLHDPSSAADMGLALDDGRLYWEPGESEIDIHFTPEKNEEIVARGNALVPKAVRAVCERAGVPVDDIDVLITNQPNRIFLRNWREELGIPEERHVDTFDELGNLYGAAAPITLAHAARGGRLSEGDLVVVAGFAHAGDFAAASAIEWSAEAAAIERDAAERTVAA